MTQENTNLLSKTKINTVNIKLPNAKLKMYPTIVAAIKPADVIKKLRVIFFYCACPSCAFMKSTAKTGLMIYATNSDASNIIIKVNGK